MQLAGQPCCQCDVSATLACRCGLLGPQAEDQSDAALDCIGTMNFDELYAFCSAIHLIGQRRMVYGVAGTYASDP